MIFCKLVSSSTARRLSVFRVVVFSRSDVFLFLSLFAAAWSSVLCFELARRVVSLTRGLMKILSQKTGITSLCLHSAVRRFFSARHEPLGRRREMENARTGRADGIRHWAGKARWLSNGRWLKRAFGTAQIRDRSRPTLIAAGAERRFPPLSRQHVPAQRLKKRPSWTEKCYRAMSQHLRNGIDHSLHR